MREIKEEDNEKNMKSQFIIILMLIVPFFLISLLKFSFLILYGTLIILQLTDLYTTFVGMKLGLIEVNPFGQFLQKKFKNLWVYIAFLIYIFILFLFWKTNTTKELLIYIIGFYSCVIANNILLYLKRKNERNKKKS